MRSNLAIRALAKTAAVCVLLEAALILAFWLLSGTFESGVLVWLFFFAPLSVWLAPTLYREYCADENAP
jgi:hypothetical protein